MNGSLSDATTGEKVGSLRRLSFTAVAGTTLIGINNHTGDFRNQRDDGKAVATVTMVDISDPTKPKVLSDRNVLAYADPPVDLLVSEYLSEFDPLLFAYGYGGTAGYVSHMAGPVPVGNKLLIQTTAFLYCIGPAIEGAAGDNPATVQAIRAAKPAELATYLNSPSALYRHTAVTAMIIAGIGGTKDVLTKLAKKDPYEQIRAAAIRALNAAEPDAAPGTQALLPLMTAAWIGGGHDGRAERRALQYTLDALGRERGTALLVAAFTKTQDEPTRQSLVDFAAVMGWAAPELTRQAQAYLVKGPKLLAVRYLAGSGLIQSDKEVLDAVKRALPHLRGNMLIVLAPPLGQVLKGNEKIVFLLDSIRADLGDGCYGGTNDLRSDYRAPFLRQLGEMGREGASAVPELEKLAAAHAHLAGEFAPVIEAIKGK